MNIIKKILVVVALQAASNAYAECPNSLPTELLMDCIVVENSGDMYDVKEKLKEWQEQQKSEQVLNADQKGQKIKVSAKDLH